MCCALKQRQQSNHRGGFAGAGAARDQGQARAQSFGTGDALPIGCVVVCIYRAKQGVQFDIHIMGHFKVLRQSMLNGRMNGLLSGPSASEVHPKGLAVVLQGQHDG